MRTASIRRLDGQGRVILPSHIRKALELSKDSRVTVDLTRDGTIMIRNAEKRCCICGAKVQETPHVTIDTRTGTKYLCESCTNVVKAVGQDD